MPSYSPPGIMPLLLIPQFRVGQALYCLTLLGVCTSLGRSVFVCLFVCVGQGECCGGGVID